MNLQIVQITDTHLSIDVPQRMHDLEKCVHAINNLEVPVDLVVHTGDITHNGLAQEYHSARQLLDQLDAPYFVMPGNRDKRVHLLNAFKDKRFALPAQGWVQYSIEDYSIRLLMVDTVSNHTNKGELCDQRLAHLEKMLSADTTKPNICGLYCGHVHRFIDGSIAGINASAITCLASDLRRGDVSEADRKMPVYKSLNLQI